MENFKELLTAYVDQLDIKHKERNDKYYGNLRIAYNGQYTKFSIEEGKKYAKINITSGGQLSVHCFVEKSTGNILKAATWKAPAKGIRGNIGNPTFPIFGGDYYIYKN